MPRFGDWRGESMEIISKDTAVTKLEDLLEMARALYGSDTAFGVQLALECIKDMRDLES